MILKHLKYIYFNYVQMKFSIFLSFNNLDRVHIYIYIYFFFAVSNILLKKNTLLAPVHEKKLGKLFLSIFVDLVIIHRNKLPQL
jgi:hypothetical protein